MLALGLSIAALGIAAGASSASPRTVRAPPPCPQTSLRPAATNLPAIEAATLCLINAQRRTHHLQDLRFNADLHAVAAGQASEMVLGNYFGDNNRAGQTPLQRIVASSYPAHAARVSTAQNIGWGTGPDATPAAMVRAWLRSPPHRQIILTPFYRDIGIGVAPAVPTKVTGSAFGATYTVEFGVRKNASGAAAATSGAAAAASGASAAASVAAGNASGAGAGLAGGTAG